MKNYIKHCIYIAGENIASRVFDLSVFNIGLTLGITYDQPR